MYFIFYVIYAYVYTHIHIFCYFVFIIIWILNYYYLVHISRQKKWFVIIFRGIFLRNITLDTCILWKYSLHIHHRGVFLTSGGVSPVYHFWILLEILKRRSDLPGVCVADGSPQQVRGSCLWGQYWRQRENVADAGEWRGPGQKASSAVLLKSRAALWSII